MSRPPTTGPSQGGRRIALVFIAIIIVMGAIAYYVAIVVYPQDDATPTGVVPSAAPTSAAPLPGLIGSPAVLPPEGSG